MLRYGQGQYYKAHMDVLSDEVAGPRVCTILLYLNGALACGAPGVGWRRPSGAYLRPRVLAGQQRELTRAVFCVSPAAAAQT